ncbi:MAG: RNA-binding protein, partial [Ferruginibacter sp.]
DNNGSYDAIPSLYLPATIQPGSPWLDFPAHGRDDMIKQMIGTRKNFQNYVSYAGATMDKIFTSEQLKGALVLKANQLASSYIQNNGHGHFSMRPLPDQAQVSALNGMITGDFDGDGNLDIAINTNDYGTDPSMGRYDGMNGLVLKGNGRGEFNPLNIMQSGIFIPGNGKALAKIKTRNNHYFLIATQNRGSVQVYKPRLTATTVPFAADDMYAIIALKNGRQQKVENYCGSSFLSQSGRFFTIGSNTKTIMITNTKGISRVINSL